MRAALSHLLGVSLCVSTATAGPLKTRRGDPSCSVTQGYSVDNVIAKGAAVAKYDYEFGYHSEALLEYYNPELSVFYDYAFPSGKLPAATGTEKGLAFAKSHITTGQSTLASDTANSGNPAALGVPALLLGEKDAAYKTAAQSQADYLLNKVARLSNGAISTLVSGAEAWDEWVMNAPPFLAYYAASTNNGTLLNYTVSQIGLYRNLLKSNSSGGWIHIDSLGSSSDTGSLSAGNGLVAYGIAQVLATVAHWGPSAGYAGTKTNLISWAKEIIDSALNAPRVGGLPSAAVSRVALDDQGLVFRYWNTIDNNFGETTGTALLAAAIFRLAVLAPDTFGSSYVQWAQVSRGGINGHVYSDGTLSPSVDPYNPQNAVPYSSGNPTGQSGGILLAAAWRDCVCAGIC